MVYGLLTLDAARRSRQLDKAHSDRGDSFRYVMAFAAIGLVASLLVAGACLACGGSLELFNS